MGFEFDKKRKEKELDISTRSKVFWMIVTIVFFTALVLFAINSNAQEAIPINYNPIYQTTVQSNSVVHPLTGEKVVKSADYTITTRQINQPVQIVRIADRGIKVSNRHYENQKKKFSTNGNFRSNLFESNFFGN